MSSATEQELRQQIQALQAQLDAAQRMGALGELAGTITHEFNNILMKLIGYAQMGLRHKDDATREKSFDTILNIAQRSKKMVATILGMARNRSDDREPTDLAGLVEDTLLLLERELNKYRVAVERNFDEVPAALVSGNQIQQVLINLLINARQAMPNGGRVILRISHDPQAHTVDLMIRDTGSGIPAEKLPKIFDSGFTTKKPDASGRGGTGLGLAMCRNVIESHQGRIRVESSVGKGTAFTIKLPAAKPTAAPAGNVDSVASPSEQPN